MAYCTYTDVQLESGTSVGSLTTANITSLIARSDEEITDILLRKGITAPASSTQLKTASIYMTIAKIKRRQSHELSRPNSLSLPGISFGTSPEAEALEYEKKANVAIALYVSINATSISTDLSDVKRCDTVMDDFKLDQTDDQVFFSIVEDE
jgi:hypothetical protein